MQLFQCQVCSQLLFFENTLCESCGSRLGYDALASQLEAVSQDGDLWRPAAGGEAQYRFCDNAQHNACNWLLPAESEDIFCIACRHNRTIPALGEADHLGQWQRLEMAKHRLFYQLIKLNLPLPTLADDPDHGLAFDFLADPPGVGAPRVLTGHDDGLITLNLAEADDAAREKLRTEMGEPYRTLLGHFRHEIGHFYWDVLVRDGHKLEQCRAVFGDDSQDYGQALQRHYQDGPPPGWQNDFISHYATSHPWEDFAETWAHYLHIVDTLETAKAFGVRIHPMNAVDLQADITLNPYGAGAVEGLIEAWLPLTFAVNSLNRSMGVGDLYPFILTPAVIHKMDFIHQLVQRTLPDDQPAA
ncbi:zinc-binding metallopeptidase family protein [Acidisoma silvae]|uniref:Zinc-binding peptidase n=1 Tax=Acidisoma silvae TaxID=2802396 RepID=A0A964DXX6_9PROT|nr:putative zinc-binding peptidase [Acidisoma silvae]MCB8874740.1 putative zinc-binding peptidase [Acidisoma silvae]